jgi:Protein of unknown function (DUF2905)
MDIQRLLIELGLLILVIGIVWPILSRIGLGRLPGYHVPARWCHVLFPSGHRHHRLVLSVLFWLFNR